VSAARLKPALACAGTLAAVLCAPAAAHAQQDAAAVPGGTAAQPAGHAVPVAAGGTAAHSAAAAAPPGSARAVRVLTLARALEIARARQPALRRARADSEAADARIGQERAALFPQLEAAASYQKTTANYAPRPGTSPSVTASRPDPNFDLHDYFNLELSATQLIWDFNRTWDATQSARAASQAQLQDERAVGAQVDEDVRVAFFAARAGKELVAVAHETLANVERHLRQIEAFVQAGTRAEIDLAQARTGQANARVAVINAENGYTLAKARLNRAIGSEHDTDYEIADETLPAVAGEDDRLETLVARAAAARPELAAIERRVRAQELTLGSIRAGHWPSLHAFTGATEVGTELDDLAWNWNAGVLLNWPIFQGGRVSAQADEASAGVVSLRAQRDQIEQEVRLEVQEARLAVLGAKAVIGAADEAMTSARERLRLAEGRYEAGVGSGIELADAQLALAEAEAQRVRAEYDLSSARARLLRVLGR
jgi:outer membrane protein